METQEILLAIFTGILAVAVLGQTVIFILAYRTMRQASDRLESAGKDLLRNVDRITAKAEETLKTLQDIGNGFMPVRDKMLDAADIVHQRVVRLDDFLEETTNGARLEVARIKDRIESATHRADELLDMVHERILVPVNEIVAITRGIRAGIDFFFRKRRHSKVDVPNDAPDDEEEMFI
ncbi:MAG: hypothetical protein JW793_14015 [Acidobacteria bacterium]|nr:hypothetical protein [Acidobacteriota bacterium]